MPLIERYSRDVNKRFFQTMGRLYKRNARKKNNNLQTAVGYPGPETSGTGIVNHTALADMPSAVIDDHTLYPLVDGTRPWAVGSDADGDLWYRASAAIARLAKGTAGQVLTMNSGATAPEWDTPTAAPLHEQHWTLSSLGYNTAINDLVNWTKRAHSVYGGADGGQMLQYTAYDFTNHETDHDYTGLSAIYKGTIISADPWAAMIDNSTQMAFWAGFRKKSNNITVTAKIMRYGSNASDSLTRVRIVVCDETGANSSSTSKLVSAVGTSWEDLTVTLTGATVYGSEMEWALELENDNGTYTGAINATTYLRVHHIAVTQY
jgi:hypothetical protein